MNVKANIRQRRQERIRHLQRADKEISAPAVHPNPEPAVPLLAFGQEREQEVSRPGEWEERMKDPEFVWKLKKKQLFEEANGERGTVFSDKQLSPDERPPRPFVRRFLLRCLMSGAVFLLLLGVYQFNHPASNQARLWVERALTEEINFTSIAAWYESRFGGPPAFLPAFRSKKQQSENVHSTGIGHFAVPVKGEVIKAYSDSTPWLEIQTDGEAPVLSMASGRVVFSGYLEETGYTLVIQHAGGLSSVYGYLKENRWQANDWIESGEIIGHTQPATAKWANTLYFAIKTEDETMNPSEVVAFD